MSAPVRFYDGDTDVLTDSGKVLACDPSRRLSYCLHVEFDEALRVRGHPCA